MTESLQSPGATAIISCNFFLWMRIELLMLEVLRVFSHDLEYCPWSQPRIYLNTPLPLPTLARWGSEGGVVSVRGNGRPLDGAGCQAIAQADRWRMAVIRPMRSRLRSIAASLTFRGLISRCFTHRRDSPFYCFTVFTVLWAAVSPEQLLNYLRYSHFVQQWNSKWKAKQRVAPRASTHVRVDLLL